MTQGTIVSENPRTGEAARGKLICPVCNHLMYMTSIERYGAALSSGVWHPDGTPCEQGEKIECPNCHATGDVGSLIRVGVGIDAHLD